MVRATMAADQFNSDQSTNECRDTKLMAIRCPAFVGAQPRSRKPNDDRLCGKRKLSHKENHDRRIVGQRRKVEWKNREKRKKKEEWAAESETGKKDSSNRRERRWDGQSWSASVSSSHPPPFFHLFPLRLSPDLTVHVNMYEALALSPINYDSSFFCFAAAKDWIHVVFRLHTENTSTTFSPQIAFVFGIRFVYFQSFRPTMDHARRLRAINSVCTTSCLWLWVSLQWTFQCPLEMVWPLPPNYILSHFSLSIRMPHALK